MPMPTGELISDAEVADIEHTAFASTNHAVTARIIVRAVTLVYGPQRPGPVPVAVHRVRST